MTQRRRRVSAASIKNGPALTPAKRPLMSTKLSSTSSTPIHQKFSDFAELKAEMANELQALKRHIDHDHASKVKEIEAHSARLKKQLKVETQKSTAISEGIDTDWRNFLADYEEDTRENKISIESIKAKVDASATNFTKVCLPELLKSVESSLDNIKNRHLRLPSSTRRLASRDKKNVEMEEIDLN